MKNIRILGLFIVVVHFAGCDNDPLDVNISTEGVEVDFHRIDQQLVADFRFIPVAGH